MNIVEVNWSEKVCVQLRDGGRTKVSLGQSDDGKWYAGYQKPYFLFEADSRIEVIEIACRALKWYGEVIARRSGEASPGSVG